MDLIVKHFNELSTTELYEILKTRSEIFVVEQDCVYQDLDDKDQDAIHVFCWNDSRSIWKDLGARYLQSQGIAPEEGLAETGDVYLIRLTELIR